MPTRSESIKKFLMLMTHQDLATLYSLNMECQVNVAQDGGERISGEYKGRTWQGWTDGLTTWKPLRIPYNANKNPSYVDIEMKFDISAHAESVGMTGWDWFNKVSKWVAFDFDAIVGHSDKHAKKLTNEELEEVKQAASEIEWVTIRKSTSGTGLHLYVFLDDVPTENHHEHAALGRAILGKLGALCGFDFVSKVDNCLPADTWIMTNDGPKQIYDLINKPFTARLNNKSYISKAGFYTTGVKRLYEITTKKGYKIRATSDHKFLKGCNSYTPSMAYPTLFGMDDIKTWRKVSDLRIGDKLYLNNNQQESWGGFGTFEDGYILGWLIGDGSLSSRDYGNNYQHVLMFDQEDKDSFEYITSLLPDYIEHSSTDLIKITHPYINELVQNFDIEKGKQLTRAIEQASSEFYEGFLSAFFDADGTANKNNAHISVSQSDKRILEVVQRMLLRLGIVTSLTKQDVSGKCTILGRECNRKDRYTLSIYRENVRIFANRIGFKLKRKQNILTKNINNISTDTYKEHFIDYIKSIVVLGEEKVYDVTVEDSHAFDANGFVVHNCGGNMWVWHRKMQGTDGLRLLKQGTVLDTIPPNWKDHIKVINGSRRKNLPQDVIDGGKEDMFEELCGQRPKVKLDSEHRTLIKYLKDIDAYWWWDQDHHMLVTHTHYLKRAHEDLNLRGFFETTSPATNLNEQQCFAYPMRRGSWVVRRYTPGVAEHESWDQDGQGWTRCYLNKEPDLQTAARAQGGLEDPSGGFIFREAEVAEKAAQLLGVTLNVGAPLRGRETKLKQHKDGRLVAIVERKEADNAGDMQGWLPKKTEWIRIYRTQLGTPTEPDIGNYDDLVRHLVTETNEDYGWMIRSDNRWRIEPLTHTKIALSSMGLNPKEINTILGSSVFKCWRVVNKPFQPEYPGDREWNRNAAQLRYVPTKDKEHLHYPTWSKILNHCGQGLNDAIKKNAWCKANGILTGGEYLKCWVASLFQEPLEPLPYLFMHGPQNSGKSIFHEALSLLFTKGYKRADAALVSSSGFNGELEGAIICVVEETDLRKNKQAYNRIKDWVTSRDLMIHAKGKTPYHVQNSTHWVHCANDHQACPIFTGDTRITMVYVQPLDPIDLIPKKQIIPMLEKEAPDFLSAILSIELPPSSDRLNVPIIATEDKLLAQRLNQTDLERFIEEKCVYAEGKKIKVSAFHDRFIEWLEPNEVDKWSKITVGRSLPPQFPKGRSKKNGQFYIGNITWAGLDTEEETESKYILNGDFLEPIEDES